MKINNNIVSCEHGTMIQFVEGEAIEFASARNQDCFCKPSDFSVFYNSKSKTATKKMPEKKTKTVESMMEWALKLATSKITNEDALELKRMIFNDSAPEIRKLDYSQVCEMLEFFQNAADVLVQMKSTCDVVRREKLDALPQDKKEKLSKDWEEIQAKRAKSGVTLTKEKDPKTIERKAKTEENQQVRKVAAQKLSLDEKMIKALQRVNPKLTKEEALAQLRGRLK
jgi:hypothetical protein